MKDRNLSIRAQPSILNPWVPSVCSHLSSPFLIAVSLERRNPSPESRESILDLRLAEGTSRYQVSCPEPWSSVQILNVIRRYWKSQQFWRVLSAECWGLTLKMRYSGLGNYVESGFGYCFTFLNFQLFLKTLALRKLPKKVVIFQKRMDFQKHDINVYGI